MKRVLLSLFVALCGLSGYAQGMGTSCNDAIFIDTAYTAALTEGEYWFTANTPALPLTIYIYPEDTTAKVADIWLDLTCTPGVYDDPKVAHMVSMGSKYGLTFPMLENPEKHYDKDGNLYYSISYDTNYRDMLYEQGVTYPIPAYVHVILYTNSTMKVESTSINTQCRKLVNTWGFDTALRLAPADSSNVYVWPIGDWIDKKYEITWESNHNMQMYDSKSCAVTRSQQVRLEYTFPKDRLIVDSTRTKSWIADIYQTELYARLYPEGDGVLKIKEVIEREGIATFVVAGVSAIVDNEALTIVATLPAGMDNAAKNEALRTAIVTNFNGDTLLCDIDWTLTTGRNPKMTYKSAVYSLKGIVVAKAEGNTDATLKSIEVDGYSIDGFSSSIATYNDVETDTETPVITAVATDELATVEIVQATAVPGTATVTVTAEAGNTQVYTINLIKGRSRNANLKEILVDGRPVPNFTPEEKYYRMEVMTLPVVTATTEDTLSTIQILQAKQVPGYAQISVTAEAGNVETYSINFSADGRIQYCLDNTDSIGVDSPVALTENTDTVLLFPVGDWTSEYLQFRWDGDTSVCVYISSTCEFEIGAENYYVLDSLLLEVPKGQEHYEYNLRPADFARLASLSVNGSLYIRFRTSEAGNMTLTRWEETCVTRGVLVEPEDVVTIGGNTHTTIYKFYVSDFKEKDVRLIWKGNSPLEAFFAQTCDFNLTSTNRYVLDPSPYKFVAGEDSVDINTATWTDWADYQDEGFIYARFVNKQTGELTFKVVADYTPEIPSDVEHVWSPLVDNLRIVAGQGSLTVRSFEAQTVGVYTIDGACVATTALAADEDMTLALPAGMYIVRGEVSALKAVVK